MVKSKFTFILISLFSLLFFTHAQASVKSNVEAYAQLPSISLMAISSDGSLIAYRNKSDGKDVVMVVNLAQQKIISAVNIEGINPNNLYFINNNIVVLVATNNIRLRGYRGRHDASWAYALNIANNRVYPLLSQGYGIYQGQTQLGRIIAASTEQDYVFMPAYESQHIYSLYRVRLDKRRKPRVIMRGTADTIDYFMNDKSEVIARERFNNKKNLHTIEARVDDAWQEIYREQTDIATKSFNGVTPDQKHLVFNSYNDKTDRLAYYTMALADGAISEPVFGRDDKDVSGVLTDVNRVVYGVRYSGFLPSYEFFDEKLNARMRGVQQALPNNYISISDYSPDWSKIMFYVDGDGSSGEYLLYANKQLSYITSLRPQITSESVNKVVEYQYTSRDGVEIPTLLTFPNNKAESNLPAILMPHGGPESHDNKSFDYMAQYFASQGYLVIQPQFRGSTGFGWRHRELGRGQWGLKMQDDLTDALTALSSEGKIDNNRVCIVGASYGGYAALAGAVFTPDLFKCVVAINGVADVDRMLQQEKRDYGQDHWVVSYWQEVIANGQVSEQHLTKISPINYVNEIKAPVLVIHGTRDEVVPFEQSERFVDEMEDADKRVIFVELEKGDHYLSKAQNRMAAMKAIHQFVSQHI